MSMCIASAIFFSRQTMDAVDLANGYGYVIPSMITISLLGFPVGLGIWLLAYKHKNAANLLSTLGMCCALGVCLAWMFPIGTAA